ncbi:integrase core domain-containing protein, partial [Geofilum rubicundum]|uniref:integrase core domain-containing protein n=1 Tax=Geofilum rubicundum TaxID=472113 RepID=UPI00138E3CBB
MWATDGKKFWINGSGWHWFFGVIDHFNDEILAWHIAKIGNRFEAIEPVRSAIQKQFGSVKKDICRGLELKLRSDHGSQYDSADFMNEMKFLGLSMSKAYVRSPECNGVIERFHRTLEKELLQIKSFNSIEEAQREIADFIDKYNTHWILHRLDHYSPMEYKRKYVEALKNAQSDTSGNIEPEDQFVLLL